MLFRYKNLVYPLAVAVNFYSLTFLYIIAGLIGQTQLAADMAIIQGGLLAIFLALSGNARSLILASQTPMTWLEVVSFRLLMVIPASLVVYFLIIQSIDIPPLLAIGLILRRSLEWFAEIELAECERVQDAKFTNGYLVLNSIGLFILLIAMLLGGTFFLVGLFFWAVIPAPFSIRAIFHVLRTRNFSFNFSWLSPHIGSSAIIGVSVYFFRILIVILADKLLAGQLFVAFAIGGLINTFYTQILGPSLIHKFKSLNHIFITCLSLVSFTTGGILMIYGTYFDTIIFSNILVLGIGASLVGGGFMVLAQWNRLTILQEYKMSVFLPDALANILLLISIPIAYFIFGETVLALMFLWSSLLTFMIYLPLIIKMKIEYAQ